jgi:hypothetical protein
MFVEQRLNISSGDDRFDFTPQGCRMIRSISRKVKREIGFFVFSLSFLSSQKDAETLPVFSGNARLS